MPIDPHVAIGAELGSLDFSWSDSDVLLYHLAIGATDLSYTLEGPGLQVLPSFGVVAPTFHMTDPPPLDLPGCDINLAQVVHGSQSITVDGPLPTAGSATVTTRISDVWDKGKAAVIWQEGVATSPAGERLWTTRSSIFVRGEGGWGGDRGTSTPVEVPDRAPDLDTTYAVLPQQYADFATMRGDTSDGLPGVAGVGEKTAASLLLKFGDLQGIVAAATDPASDMAPGPRGKITTALDYLDVAPRVVAVVRDLDLGDPDLTLPAAPHDIGALAQLQEQWGLGSSVERLTEVLAANAR